MTTDSAAAARIVCTPPAAYAGACLGGVLAPSVSWLLLRRVPFRRAAGWSVLGAVGGSLVGWTLGTLDLPAPAPRLLSDEIVIGLLGAVAGFVATAVVLRWHAGRVR